MSIRAVAIDWPSWINAITIVVLAAITYWYARTTRNTLAHLRLERDDRLKTIRQPYLNIIDVAEALAAKSEVLPRATAFRDEFADIGPAWSRLHDDSRDTIFDVRVRSELVYATLIAVRESSRLMRDMTLQVVGGLRGNVLQDNTRTAMAERLRVLRFELTAAREAVASLW